MRWRYFFEGLVPFSLNQFEEAAAVLKKGRPDFQSMMPELAAYGHLGRSAEAALLLKEINDHVFKGHDPKLSILRARTYWIFREHADSERVLGGLRKAGVPELPSGYDAKSKDRLTGEEIKSLVFGHEHLGRDVASGNVFVSTISADGVISTTGGGLVGQRHCAHRR